MIKNIIILSINKHLRIDQDAYPLETISLHIDSMVCRTLQSTRHKVILNGLRKVTSDRQAISHDPSYVSVDSVIEQYL